MGMIPVQEIGELVSAERMPVVGVSEPSLCKEKKWYVVAEDGDWCAHPKSLACSCRDYGSLKTVRCYSSGDDFVEYCLPACRVREEDQV